MSKMQGHQTVIEAAQPIIGATARANLDTQVANINASLNVPLRLAATFPTPNAVLNIAAQEVVQGDGAGTSAPPLNNNIPTVAASTLNLQTGATSGATFVGFTLPTTTTGQYRRMGLTMLSNGNIQCLFTPAAATIGALANAGTVFVSGGIPIGWVDLEATASNAFKTIGSATNIIENSVGGVARIHRFGSGGSGGGSGNANVLDARLQEQFNDSFYNFMTPSIFAVSTSLVDAVNTTAVTNVVNQTYTFAATQVLRSLQCLDTDFLNDSNDILNVGLTAFWFTGAVDTGAAYQVSRNGGIDWQTITMSRVSETETYTGNLTFASTETLSTLQTYAVANADGTDAFTVTTQSQISIPFVVASAQVGLQIEVYINKLGNAAGTFTAQIVKDTGGGLPSTVNADNLGSTNPISISALTAGNNTVTVSMMGSVVMPAGNYHLVLTPDSTYAASFVAATHQIALRVDLSSPPTPFVCLYNSTTSLWATGIHAGCYKINGRALDLRVKVTGSMTSELAGFGISYDSTSLLISGKLERQQIDFSGSSNINSFTISNFLPNTDTLKVFDVANGQVWVSPAFDINGQTVTFPANTFNAPGQSISLVFDQTQGSAIDTSDSNSNNIAMVQNNLASGFQGFVNQSNLITAPSTSITNRAQIADPSSDLSVKFGVERIMTGPLSLKNAEFGVNFEPVYETTDPRIRFVGSTFSFFSDLYGQRVQATGSVTTDYCEITFYGTGLNLLTAHNAANLAYAKIDGGAEGSSIFSGLTGSSVLNSRGYSLNQVVAVANNLPLQTHTIQIRVGGSLAFYGFEILNSSAVVNSGSSYKGGKKLTLASQQAFTYNSGFESGTLGTRGGRVLVYQKSDGTVAKSVIPTNTTATYLAAADHTNEEVLRNYHWREFGAGRTDDFSSLTTTLSGRGFTLDDGTTSLVGTSVSVGGALDLALANAAILTFVFVGTGLDIVGSPSASPVSIGTVSINGGASVGTYSRTVGGVAKIVSGLPYGTHTVRITNTSGGTAGVCSNFIVYGPKKPSLPTGAVELADYNIMATYDGTTATGTALTDIYQMPVGVLTKSVARELVYVGANWSVTNGTDALTGTSAGTLLNNAQPVSYNFFGTGIELLVAGSGAGTFDFTVTIDGALNASGVNRANDTNLTGGSYRAASGSGLPVRVEFTGLTLGRHTISISRSAGTGNSGFQAFHIITPIHNITAKGYADLGSPLTVGSCGVSDNRQLTPVKETDISTDYLHLVSPAAKTGISSVQLAMTNNWITIPNGQEWELNGSVRFYNSGGSPGFTFAIGAWSNTPGDDVTGGTPSGPANLLAGFSQTTMSLTTQNSLTLVAPTVRCGPGTVYLVPFASITTPAFSRVETYIYAKRVK